MKHPSSSKYDYSDNIKITPWYVRIWCKLFHADRPASYNTESKTFRCMTCNTEWESEKDS